MGNLVTVTGKRFDPLLRDLELEYKGTYYPVGFPLHIATNSQHVLEAAAESWSHWRQEFDVEPITFRVVIERDGELAGKPTFRMQGHLLEVVSDANNFANADTRSLFASFHLSEKTAADHPWMRWFYTESMAYFLLTQRYVVGIHAGCVARRGKGLLLCGCSGSGKSTLSFACARAGWTYVADDCTWLLADSTDRVAIGKPHQVRFRDDAPEHFPELAGYVARTRPNGKLSIEAPTSWFPGIETAARCATGGLVFLDRESGGAPRLEPMAPAEAIESLIANLPSYGEDVNAMHERTVQGLTGVPAWRMHYRSLDEALRLLSEIEPR
jgi:hypothetical protein